MRLFVLTASFMILASFALDAEDSYLIESGVYLSTPFIVFGPENMQTYRFNLAAGVPVARSPGGGSTWGKGELNFVIGQWMDLELGVEAGFDIAMAGKALRSRLSPGLALRMGYGSLGLAASLRFEPAILILERGNFPRLSLSVLPTVLRYRGFDANALFVECGILVVGVMGE